VCVCQVKILFFVAL